LGIIVGVWGVRSAAPVARHKKRKAKKTHLRVAELVLANAFDGNLALRQLVVSLVDVAEGAAVCSDETARNDITVG
jgi:hypothetical protein